MRTDLPRARLTAWAGLAASSSSRSSDRVATSVSRTSLPCPMASRMEAKYLMLTFMGDFQRRSSRQKRGKRDEPHPIAVRNALARRVINQAVAPNRGSENARALVAKQFQSACGVLLHTQEFTAFIGSGPIKICADSY